MKCEVKLNQANITKIEQNIQKALSMTADAIKTDLQDHSQTMPFKDGTLQDDMTFVDNSKVKKGNVYIVSDTPYARRLYFHPEYNFNREHNPNAGGKWFEPYITGAKKDLCLQFFARYMRN